MEISDDRVGGRGCKEICGEFGILHVLLKWVKTAVWLRGEMAGRRFQEHRVVGGSGVSCLFCRRPPCCLCCLFCFRGLCGVIASGRAESGIGGGVTTSQLRKWSNCESDLMTQTAFFGPAD